MKVWKCPSSLHLEKSKGIPQNLEPGALHRGPHPSSRCFWVRDSQQPRGNVASIPGEGAENKNKSTANQKGEWVRQTYSCPHFLLLFPGPALESETLTQENDLHSETAL